MGDGELVTVRDTGKRCQVGCIKVDTQGGRCGSATGNRCFIGVQVGTKLDICCRSGRRQDRVDIKNLQIGNGRAV